MSISERKKAIKLTADVAMASTRHGRTGWSQALIANASKDSDNKVLIKQILASTPHESDQVGVKSNIMMNNDKRIRSNKILKRSCSWVRRVRKRVGNQINLAKSIAKKMVKRRTQVLKSLVPGGEFMDDISLIEETLDYIVSLRAQVDVMRSLVKAKELVSSKLGESKIFSL